MRARARARPAGHPGLTALEILRAQNRRATPWKNGGGSTAEIAAGPVGATLDAFDWRVSMASVAREGPFSRFEGIDRSLAIIEGDGLVLTVEGRPPVILTGTSEPLTFPGDARTDAMLLGGEVRDLNVMTRRGRCAHRLSRLDVRGPAELREPADILVLLCTEGAVEVGAQGARLGAEDAALVRPGAGEAVRVEPLGAALCYLVLIRSNGIG